MRVRDDISRVLAPSLLSYARFVLLLLFFFFAEQTLAGAQSSRVNVNNTTQCVCVFFPNKDDDGNNFSLERFLFFSLPPRLR